MTDAASFSSFERYSSVAIVLHWIIAVLMIVNVGLGLSADAMPETWIRPFINTHKSIGITVLGLGLLRLLWRIGHKPPALPSVYPRWERTCAHAVHALLYILVFALPLSGWLHDSAWKDAATHPMKLFDLIDWPRISFVMNLDPQTKETAHTVFGMIHTRLAYVLYLLVFLHVAGALKHQFIDKAPQFARMMPTFKRKLERL